MSYLKHLNKALNDFGRNVISKSRSNLTRKKKTDTKRLYAGLSYKTIVGEKSSFVVFDLGKYGNFVDKGVKGKDPSKVIGGKKAKRGQQAPLSPYRFGRGTYKGTFDSFASSVGDWAKRKGYRLRDEKGRFKKGDYQTIGRIIAGNIYNRGIKPSLFFTNPYNVSKKKLPQKVAIAFAMDLADQIKKDFNNRQKRNNA